jgi:hypothetical protein
MVYQDSISTYPFYKIYLLSLGLWASYLRSLGRVGWLLVGPLSFSPSPVSRVPMVPNLISNPRVLGKWTFISEIQIFLVLVNFWVLSIVQNNWPSGTNSILMWIVAPIRCSPRLPFQISLRIDSWVNLTNTSNFNSFYCFDPGTQWSMSFSVSSGPHQILT